MFFSSFCQSVVSKFTGKNFLVRIFNTVVFLNVFFIYFYFTWNFLVRLFNTVVFLNVFFIYFYFTKRRTSDWSVRDLIRS